MTAQQPAWKTLVQSAYEDALVHGRTITPTPIAVGPPENDLFGVGRRIVDVDDPSAVEVIPEGKLGWAWVDFESDGSESGDAFVNWLTVNAEAGDLGVPVDAYERHEDDSNQPLGVVRIRIDGLSDSVEPCKAAADVLAARIEGAVPGIRAISVERLN